MSDPDHTGCNECEGCPLTDRRTFVRDALSLAAAALASLGLAGHAEALPLGFARALSAHADQRTYPIPAADGVQIDRENEVILARWQGAVYAFNLSCPHQHTALRWQAADSRFQCPKHKSKYRPDGSFISGRATRAMDRFAVSHQGGNVVVDLGTMYKQNENQAAWSAALIRV